MLRFQSFLALAVVSGLAATASAQTADPYQPSQRPLGLSVVGPTYKAGSDSASQAFEQTRQKFLNTIQKLLPEGKVFTGAGVNRLDPTRLYFGYTYTPRVYFLYVGACYDNALGVTIAQVAAPTSKPVTGTNYTIFPLVHSSIAPVCASGTGKRSKTEPLLSGDFVQLPTVNAGEQLAFFIMAEMDSSGKPTNVFYNGESNNADNFQHLIAFFPDNSQYIIIGFEDMFNGGDKDCNDLLFAVDIGGDNATYLRDPSNMPR
ncbi:MAG TPA: DUF4114 domain-containing protein [Pirellulales bacterium]|nr:DUF4114 domain-containing protein [Pirellulales bacterium]